MRKRTLTALIFAAFLMQACGERAPEGATVIRAAHLYTAPDRPPIDDAAVVIVDGRIAAAGPHKGIAIRGAAALAQCDGGTVVAGFQNSHVHFTEPKFADAADKPAAELDCLARRHAEPLRLHDGRGHGLGHRQHRGASHACRCRSRLRDRAS